MPFNPQTPDDVAQMLAAIGVETVDDLFDEIPKNLRIESLAGIPDALSEMELGRLMSARAAQDGTPLNFIGAGAYEHHIPSAVWAITTRGEFYSAYTPYQAEASQGTLQLIYEFQTMMTRLTGLDVSNAPMYAGAAARLAPGGGAAGRGLVPRTVPPAYRKTLATIAQVQNIEVVELDYERASGRI